MKSIPSLFFLLQYLLSPVSSQAQCSTFTAVSDTFFICGNNAAIEGTFDVAGGTPPYQIIWPAPFNDTTGLDFFRGFDQGDVLNLIALDANDCLVDFSMSVLERPAQEMDVSIYRNDCSSVILTSIGANGAPLFAHLWSNGSTNPEALLNTPGTIWVMASDANGCPYEATFTIEDFDVNVEVFPICAGQDNGKIIANVDYPLTAFPGSLFAFNWSGPNSFTTVGNTIENLNPGDYFLTVTDNSSGEICGEYGPYSVTAQSLDYELTINQFTPSCSGGNDGSLVANLMGPTSDASYLWNTNWQNPILSNATAGNYSVTATDTHGCTYEQSVELMEPSALDLMLTGIEPVCKNEGEVAATGSGGTGPYHYNWSNNTNANIASNLAAGNYSLTLTDSNNCSLVTEFELPSNIELEVESTFADCAMDNGTATAKVSGAITNIEYAWSNNENTSSITDLSPAWYSVTVTDTDTECFTHQNIEVLEDSICYVRIAGYVKTDAIDEDCQSDSLTLPAKNIMVELSDGQITFTNEQGYYEFITDAGTYTISLINITSPFVPLCSDPQSIDAANWGTTYVLGDFYLSFDGVSDLKVNISKGPARPGFLQTVKIALTNNGAIPNAGTLAFNYSELQEVNSFDELNAVHDPNNNLLEWEFINIMPGEQLLFTVIFLTPVGTPLLTPLNYSVTAPLAGDINPWDNEISCGLLVTGSFDPNDKAVTPAGEGSEGVISPSDSLLEYRVRFQNTGTDTAFTVVIRDTLSEFINIASLQPGASSHPYQARMIEDNVLEFFFDNIYLPDSTTDLAGSNGFVFFEVLLKNNLPLGTAITNEAAIYFDFNEPVITNTVVNTIKMPSAVTADFELENTIHIVPNPVASNHCQLIYEMEEAEIISIRLFSSAGKLIKTLLSAEMRGVGEHREFFNLEGVAAGTYLLRVEGERGAVRAGKVVKL